MATDNSLYILETQELRKATILKLAGDILVTRYKFDVQIEEADAAEIDEAHMNMCRGKDVYVIADLQKGKTNISKEAEEYFTTKGRMVPYIKGVALVMDSKPSIFANFLMKLHNTIYPTKSFGSLEDAVKWIDKQG